MPDVFDQVHQAAQQASGDVFSQIHAESQPRQEQYQGPPPFEPEGMGFSQIGPQDPGERAPAVATGVGVGAGLVGAPFYGPPAVAAARAAYAAHPVIGNIALMTAISKAKELPIIGPLLQKIPNAELIPFLLGTRGAGRAAEAAGAGEAAAGETVAAETGAARAAAKPTQQEFADQVVRAAGGNPGNPAPPQSGQPIARRPATSEMIPINKSSALNAYHYDPESQVMTIETKGGSSYRFGEVSPDDANDFINADSKGKAFQSFLNNNVLLEKNYGKGWIRVKPPQRMASPEGSIPLSSLVGIGNQ
jgi:hypothetical protein